MMLWTCIFGLKITASGGVRRDTKNKIEEYENNFPFFFPFLPFQFEQKSGAVFEEIVENCKYHLKKKIMSLEM
jgi:hypothetical protein